MLAASAATGSGLKRLHLVVEQQHIKAIFRPQGSEQAFQGLVAAFKFFPLHGQGSVEKDNQRFRRTGCRTSTGIHTSAFPVAQQRFRLEKAGLVGAADRSRLSR